MNITTETIMTTGPCSDYPRERVESILATLTGLNWRLLAWEGDADEARATSSKAADTPSALAAAASWGEEGLFFICQVLDEKPSAQ